MLTHANLLGTIGGMHAAFPWPEDGTRRLVPAVRPHRRPLGFHYAALMTYGYTITTCADPKQLMQIVGQVQPTFFGGVPRIWEKLKAGLEAMVAGQEDPEVRARIEGAIDAAVREGPPRAGRRAGARGARRGRRGRRRAALRAAARGAGPRRTSQLERRRRRADAARGARVLRRDRPAAVRGLGA